MLLLSACAAAALGQPLQPSGDANNNAARDYLHRISTLTPVPCRDDFAKMAQTHFNVNGRAAEIGVYRGEFAEKNLRHWRGEYHMIDAWYVTATAGSKSRT